MVFNGVFIVLLETRERSIGARTKGIAADDSSINTSFEGIAVQYQ